MPGHGRARATGPIDWPLRSISGQEFYAVGRSRPGARPPSARLARRNVRGTSARFETVSDAQRGVGHDLGAARRDVQDEAFDLRHPGRRPSSRLRPCCAARAAVRAALLVCCLWSSTIMAADPVVATQSGRGVGSRPSRTNDDVVRLPVVDRFEVYRLRDFASCKSISLNSACAVGRVRDVRNRPRGRSKPGVSRDTHAQTETIGGQAQAEQPAAAPAAVPDQMPFDIPYGNSITADRAADVVKAIVAEATKSPRNWKLAISVVDTHGDLVYFYKMDSTQQASVTISQNKARTAARYRRPTQIFNNAMQTPAGAYVANAGVAAAGRIARRYPARRGRQDHRRGRLQRRDRRPGRRGLQGRRGHGEVVAASLLRPSFRGSPQG